MNKKKITNETKELFVASHLLMILTYTIFSVVLICETLVMDWEKWAIVLIIGGVVAAWYIHFSQMGSEDLRLWVCSLLMMATFFFYGTHATSTFDLSIVICVVMILYTMTGISSLVTLCQVTYYVTMFYELVGLAESGQKFDRLFVTRLLLHVVIVTAVAWIGRAIISKWNEVLVHADEEIGNLNESAEKLNDFIANVSHEIRTPINAILGMCGMCLTDEHDINKRANLKAIEDAGKRMGEQISDILDYSEIDRSDLANNCEDFMLASLLNDLVNELKPYRKNDIELIIDVDASLPSMLNSDVGKIKKILWHLIVNGLKFTNDGGVYVHLFSVKHEYGINLCMEIKDTGIGMNENQLEKIYDNFYKADSGRTRTTGGLGLGMIIVRGFVRSLGGFMTVDSKEGEGTCVKVSIPAKVVDDGECMSVNDRENISLGAYLHFEKYPNPNVREYYDSMVKNIVTGLKVTMHRVDNIASLHALVDNKKLTHLFAGPEEYSDNAEYMEQLAKTIIVTVIANPEELDLPASSRVRVMPKPFYCFPVVGVLNSKIDEDIYEEGEITFPGAKVLVVDDEPMNLIVSAGMFKRYGMIVTTCESGQEAIDLCRQNDYDIIFMDHMMPVMDGVEAMTRIRADQAKGRVVVPIVAFTANAVSSAKEMFKQAGFDGFVGKPVDRVELERVLKRILPPSLVHVEMTIDRAANTSDEDKDAGGADRTVTGEKPTAAAAGDKNIFERLSSIGVDTEKGLFYSQNDRDFYESLLAQYLKESVKKKQIISEALKAGDMKSYSIQVHSIKSTSKMIGALTLSEEARLLEEAAKSNDREYVDEYHEAMMTSYNKVLEMIGPGPSKAFSEEDMPGSEEEDDSDLVLEFAPDNGDAEGGNRP